MKKFVIVGAGLAGCECALVLAKCGMQVILCEQKPFYRSQAHVSQDFAELVCSNSMRSDDKNTGIGLLKAEMRALKSPFMQVADACRIPAGNALAVDREKFASQMTALIHGHPAITVIHERIESLDQLQKYGDAEIIIAGGPLMQGGLMDEIRAIAGFAHCYFYDAIAPIIWTESLNHDVVFRASRYENQTGEAGDYFNCPMSREQYQCFYEALLSGKTFKGHDEEQKHFEGCMPIEALAARGPRTLTFGPMKPVGLVDPRTGKRPWAVLQLRPEKANMETCNLVGCQTKLLQGEQLRIFRLIPGMEHVEFARYGSMHRNTYVDAPVTLGSFLELRRKPQAHLAGQITGVEGYVESAACGLWLGLSLAARERQRHLSKLPEVTALGALMAHLGRPVKNFQPSNITFGLMPELPGRMRKKERKTQYSLRAERAFADWLKDNADFLRSLSNDFG